MVRVYWTDTHNTTSGWETQAGLEEFINDSNWHCSNVGWLAYEDDDCVGIAARSTFSHDQWGLIERIPKRMVEKIVDLTEPFTRA